MANAVVLLNSGPKEAMKVRSALRLAEVLKDTNQLDDVRFLFFADGLEVLRRNLDGADEYGPMIDTLIEKQVFVAGCQVHAERAGVVADAELRRVPLLRVGPELARLISAGYQVISF